MSMNTSGCPGSSQVNASCRSRSSWSMLIENAAAASALLTPGWARSQGTRLSSRASWSLAVAMSAPSRGDGLQPPYDRLAQVRRVEHHHGRAVRGDLLGQRPAVGEGDLERVEPVGTLVHDG